MKHTKGDWEVRKLFNRPIKVEDEEGRSWLSNTYSIHDNTNRIICEVDYQSDTTDQGYGKNETIEKAEANAKLIAEAGTVANECGLSPRQLLEQRNQLLSNLQRIVDRIEECEFQNSFPSAFKRAELAIKKATE